ncbi:MAG TPA: isoprenylcysteine carboxylmethyltransferase family protein [Chthoniobacterales bacterium]|jgi:protein-S-isoprenylcysteine O-methyltransferase Ste14
MSELIARFTTLPPYGLGGLVILLLYGLQSEIRFGARARTMRAGASDRWSTLAVSFSAAVAVLGFVCGIKAHSTEAAAWLPHWFRRAIIPGLPGIAWCGVAIAGLGLCLRLWAVLTLRERYTRTLLVQDEHSVERSGPYGWIRHPGYLGSLLCLNGVALASGNLVALSASLLVTFLAYGYRIKVEDEMLVESLGSTYADYRHEIGALFPFRRSTTASRHSRPVE